MFLHSVLQLLFGFFVVFMIGIWFLGAIVLCRIVQNYFEDLQASRRMSRSTRV